MAAQARKHMMTVLPGRRGKHQPSLGMNLHEDVHPHALRGDEAVLFFFAISMGADQLEALLREGRGQLLFHVTLRGPTHLVGTLAQVAAGDQKHFIRGGFWYFEVPHCLFDPFS